MNLTEDKMIFRIENFLSNTDCDLIKEYIDKEAIIKSDWKSGNNVRCFYCNLQDTRIIETKVKIENIIYSKMIHFQNKLYNMYNLKIHGDSGYCLRKIYGKTRNHIDGIFNNTNDIVMSHNDGTELINIKNNIRCLSCIIILNDDYEGCEFFFPHQSFRIKPRKGELIAFPPFWTHPHEVSAPTKNNRYTINTWLYGDYELRK